MPQIKKLEIRTLPIQLHKNIDNKLGVSGYVNITGSLSEPIRNSNGDYFRETIAPGVFNSAIGRAKRVDFLAEHDITKILATTENSSLELEEDSKGLFMSAQISATSWGRDAYQLIIDGIIQGLSFGMIVLDQEWSTCDDGLPLRTINAIEIFEVSAVRHPAYKSSSVEARGIEQINDVEIPIELRKEDKEMAKKPEESKKSTEKEDVKDPKKEEVKKSEDSKKPEESKKVEEKSDDSKKSDEKPDEKRSDEPDDSAEDGKDTDKSDSKSEERANDDGLASINTKLDKILSILSKSSSSEKRDEEPDDTSEDRAKEDKKEKKEPESRSLEEYSELRGWFFD